jgi:flavodoxin
MKKVLIIYHSKTGTTKSFGEEIGKICSENESEYNILSIKEFTPDALLGIDYLFLGCWTNGIFFFLQHPDKDWINFTRQLPENIEQKLGLFTTYKLATGSMFKKMKQYINYTQSDVNLELKSRNGFIRDSDLTLLRNFIKN